jgi:tetratricopeptide (TPR) repeat protein
MHGQWSHAWMRGNINLSLQQAEALLEQARARESHGGLAIAWSAMGHSQFILGRFPEALESLERALDHDARTERDRRYGLALQATVISTRCYAAWARTFMGRLAATRRDLMTTLEAAEAAAFPFAIANAHYALGRYDYDTGAEETCIARLRTTIALCEEHDIEYLAMAAKAIVGLLLGRRGDHEGGLALVREALDWNRAAEALTFVPNYLGMEAELMAQAGDSDGALQRMTEAFALMAESGAQWEKAVLVRQRGEILGRAGRSEEAETELRAAMAVAEAHRAALYRLHAAIPLAALLARTARGAEGRATLEAALMPLAAEAEPIVLRARAALDAIQRLP